MKAINNILRLLSQFSLWCIFICAFCCPAVYGQYTVSYAQYLGAGNTGGIAGTGGAAGNLGGTAGEAGTYSVTNTGNLNDNIYTNYAILSAISGKPGSGIGVGNGASSTVYINMNFTGTITPTSSNPIILKLQASNSNSGLAPLSQVTIQAYNGASLVGTSVAVSTLTVRSTDEYVFVPAGTCTSIRITATTDIGSVLFGAASNTTVNLFYAYVLDPTCGPPVYTATSVTGLLSLNGTINNPNNAIDNNMSSYSTFSVGIGVGATLHQNVYYGGLSGSGDVATLTLSIPSSSLAAGLLGSISIIAYNGNTQVNSVSFSALLQGTDLLSLLQAGSPTTISFDPGAVFDRVEITMSSLVGVATSLNLYEVSRTGKAPSFTLPVNDTVYACYGTNASLAADVPAAGYELRWFANGAASDQTALYTGTTFSSSGTTTHDTIFWVGKFKTGCSAGSEKVPVRVLVRPLPTITLGVNPIVCMLGSNAVLPYSVTTNNPIKYSIVWAASALANIVDNTLAANSILINIPIGTSIGTKNGTLTVKNANNCSSSGIPMSVTVKSPPVITPPIVTNYQ